MNQTTQLEKLKCLVEETKEIDIQLKNILKNLNNLEDIIQNAENISDRVSKSFKLYKEFTEIIDKEV